MMGYITVDVGKLGCEIKTFTLEEGTTVTEAINLAGYTVESGYEIRVDGEVANGSETLADGATVVITKMIKGN